MPIRSEEALAEWDIERWPTAEQVSFEGKKKNAALAFIGCITTVVSDDSDLTSKDAEALCLNSRGVYATYLPAEEAEMLLHFTAYNAAEQAKK